MRDIVTRIRNFFRQSPAPRRDAWAGLRFGRLKPARLAVAAFVAVISLFAFSFAWLGVTKVAKHKVEATLARVGKKLGMPIDVGRWRIGPGGAFFEGIAIGDGTVVISKMNAEIGLNPFSDDFGKLTSVVVHNVKVKSVEGAFGSAPVAVMGAPLASDDLKNGRLPRPREAPNEDNAPAEEILERAAKARKLLEKVFAALPTERLLIKSGAVTLVDQSGEPRLTVTGLKLMVDRKEMKALFQAAAVKSGPKAANIVDQGLDGRFELMPNDGAYRFYLRRRPSKDFAGKHGKNGWSVTGRVKKDLSAFETDFDFASVPAVFALWGEKWLGKSPRLLLKGKIKGERNSKDQGSWKIALDAESGGTRLIVPLLSPVPVGPARFSLAVKATFEASAKTVSLDDFTLTLPQQLDEPQSAESKTDRDARGANDGRGKVGRLQILASGQGHFPGADLSAWELKGQIALPSTYCQTILEAMPPGLLPALSGFKLEGQAGATVDFRFDGKEPENLVYDFHDAKYGCRVKEAPFNYSAEHLGGPFTLARQVSKDDEPLEISVSPLRPGYTPLAQVSKMVGAAFTTSEDASFYSHKGIDTFAIDNALRKNLTEQRVAVGGSTITMQTAKNLFLTQERTLSRKMQELFLAWHLENVLDKERILEIYLNIVEYGPGIYGITQASEHFFGKHPFDLTLMESAYLAELLPNPKARYQYFCDGKLTPAFQELVHGLLKRMVNLNRIPYERYYQALSTGIHFNDQARSVARECLRQTTNRDGSTEATARSPRPTAEAR